MVCQLSMSERNINRRTSAADACALDIAAGLGLVVELADGAARQEGAAQDVRAAVSLDSITLTDDVAGLRWA